jgi:hypothetical protein
MLSHTICFRFLLLADVFVEILASYYIILSLPVTSFHTRAYGSNL